MKSPDVLDSGGLSLSIVGFNLEPKILAGSAETIAVSLIRLNNGRTAIKTVKLYVCQLTIEVK
jgi:hypothetical protein